MKVCPSGHLNIEAAELCSVCGSASLEAGGVPFGPSSRLKLSSTNMLIVAGVPAQLQVEVRNNSDEIVNCQLSVMGDLAPWAAVQPEAIRLFPAEQGVAQLQLAVPRATHPPAGGSELRLDCRSSARPGTPVTAVLSVDLAPFRELGRPELLPQTVSVRRNATVELTVANRGNGLEEITVDGRDPADALRFVPLAPIVCHPGQVSTTAVPLRCKRMNWFGGVRVLPYTLRLAQDTPLATSIDGTVRQRAFLTSLLVVLLLLVCLLVLLLSGAAIVFGQGSSRTVGTVGLIIDLALIGVIVRLLRRQ